MSFQLLLAKWQHQWISFYDFFFKTEVSLEKALYFPWNSDSKGSCIEPCWQPCTWKLTGRCSSGGPHPLKIKSMMSKCVHVELKKFRLHTVSKQPTKCLSVSWTPKTVFQMCSAPTQVYANHVKICANSIGHQTKTLTKLHLSICDTLRIKF